MPTFSIDNDRVTAGIQDVTYDQSAGVQTPTDGNEVNVTLSSGELDGLDSDFETFLTSLSLSTTQKNFAVNTDAASSSSAFIRVTADPGETINGLTLLADSSTALASLQTLAGESIYVHVDASGDYATLTTAGGRIVGALALTNETVDNTTTHTATAGVQMVYFEAIKHTDTTSADESIPLGDVLKVAVDTAVSFNFSQLAAGNFLWAAVGDSSSAMLITGQDLNVIDTPGKLGDMVNGGSDPSDSVNTSKATSTTIGINAQHFAPTNSGDGATGVFTFVSGYKPLALTTPQYTGGNITQVDYDSYINVSSASVFISQLTSGSSAKISFSLLEAGGGGTADHLTSALLPEEGYNANSTNKYSYIGNQDSDSNLKDDTPVGVATVTVRGFTWDSSTSGTLHNGVTVTISGNNVIVDGAHANDLITFTAVNDAADPLDGTFNRIDIQALSGSASFDIGHVDLTSGGLTNADLGSHLFVDDDGPALGLSTDAAKPNDLQVPNTLNAMDDSFYVLTPGTDGQKSSSGYSIVASDGTFTADTSGTYRWSYSDTTNHTSIVGSWVDSSNVSHNFYTLSLDSSTGAYTFQLTAPIPGTDVALGSTIIHAGGPTNSIDVAAKAPSDDYAHIVGSGAVNASHGFVGVDNGNLDAGESLTLSLYDSNGTATLADDTLIDFSSLTIGTKSAGLSHYDYVLTMSDSSTVEIDNVAVPKGQVITVNDPNPLDNVLIESVQVFKVDGNALKIGLGSIHFTLPPDDLQLGFTAKLTDGDNDTALRNFTVGIDGNNDGSFDATVNSLSVINDHLFV